MLIISTTRRRLAAVGGVAALALAVVGGTALAGHLTGDVKSYTGCLVPNDGVIIKVKEGNAPKSACNAGQTQVHLSGCDITKIAVTGALTGGGDNGEVTIGLKPEFTLPSGCATGQVAKWNGSGWACAADNDTTYNAGTGLSLSGTQFSVHPDYQVKNKPDCPAGQFATGFDSDGDIQCAAPAATTGVQAYSATASLVTVAGTTTVISKTIPAGLYLLFASVELQNGDAGVDSSAGSCSIPGWFEEGIHIVPEADVLWPAESLSLSSAITHPGGPVELTCTEQEADVDVSFASLVAIKVGSLG